MNRTIEIQATSITITPADQCTVKVSIEADSDDITCALVHGADNIMLAHILETIGESIVKYWLEERGYKVRK